MKGLLPDCRHAARLYVRTPGASLTAVAVLAIGMAFVASFVSLYVDLIMKLHPGFEDSGRIVSYGRYDGPRAGYLPLELIDRIAEESTTLEAAAGVTRREFRVAQDDSVVWGGLVTREFFGGLRPKLALGRGFERAEHEPDAGVAVISFRYWQQVLGGRNDVLGTTLEVQRAFRDPFSRESQESGDDQWTGLRIVGVMAPEFTGILSPRSEDETAFWLPIEQLRSLESGQDMVVLGRQISLKGIGRRARGASPAAVASELSGRYSEDGANSMVEPGTRFGALNGLVFNADIQRSTQRQLSLFLGGSVLLALVAAANVSLFLLARAPGRRRELGIRMAVGARLKRLARQLASEAGLLIVISATLGFALSIWLSQLLQGLEFLRQAEWGDVTLLDWRVLAIVGAFLAFLTLLVSLAPIVGLQKLGIATSSRQVSARPGVAQCLAGTVQIAIAGTLGGAAAAFAWHLGSLMFGYPGYETRDLHVVRYSIDSRAYFVGWQWQWENFFVDQTRRHEALASLPGVTGVSLPSAVPGMRGGVATLLLRDPNESTSFGMIRIDSDYVDLLGLTLLHGRGPTMSEPDAVLVNQTFARMLWGREDVVGEQLPDLAESYGEVVGVVADLPYEHPSADVSPLSFVQWGVISPNEIALIRSGQTSAALRQQIQGLVDTGALELTIDEVAPLTALRSSVLTADRARGFLTIGTAALVVLLAAFGFYGTQRYLVAAGRREYAIRAALGAGPRALGRLVVWRGLLLGLPGMSLGLLLAFIVVALLRDDYVGRDTSPIAVTIAVAVGLVAVLMAASLGPALQARRAHPAPLLREE